MTELLKISGKTISVKKVNGEDYISLTDMAKSKNEEDPRFVVQNWMKTRSTIEFLGLWEELYNKDFKPLESEGFKNNVGLNAFLMSPKKWIDGTNAIGIISKSYK